MSLLKPVCVKCHCFFRPEKNGFIFIEGKPDNKPTGMFPEDIRGVRYPEAWSPYKLWTSDKWKCPDCGHEILSGFGGPISQDYLPGFEEACKISQMTVNDC